MTQSRAADFNSSANVNSVSVRATHPKDAEMSIGLVFYPQRVHAFVMEAGQTVNRKQIGTCSDRVMHSRFGELRGEIMTAEWEEGVFHVCTESYQEQGAKEVGRRFLMERRLSKTCPGEASMTRLVEGCDVCDK